MKSERRECENEKEMIDIAMMLKLVNIVLEWIELNWSICNNSDMDISYSLHMRILRINYY